MKGLALALLLPSFPCVAGAEAPRAGPPASAPQSDVRDKLLARQSEEIRGVLKDIEQGLDGLEQLAGIYLSAPDPESLFQKRGSLREAVNAAMERLGPLEKEWNQLRLEREREITYQAMSAILAGKGDRGVQSDVGAASDRLALIERVNVVQHRADAAIRSEEAAYFAARSALETRRRVRLALLAALAVAGAAAALWLARLRPRGKA